MNARATPRNLYRRLAKDTSTELALPPSDIAPPQRVSVVANCVTVRGAARDRNLHHLRRRIGRLLRNFLARGSKASQTSDARCTPKNQPRLLDQRSSCQDSVHESSVGSLRAQHSRGPRRSPARKRLGLST